MSDRPADSAGVPWHDRQLTSTGFDDDDGSADPRVRAASADGDDAALMSALAASRLLVPIVAVLAEGDGHGGDKAADMAVVTLSAPDGERALPVFTSLAAMAAWDPQARPSPVTAERAAQAAVSERCDVMVLDLGGSTRVLRPSMVWALAQQRPWLPAADDPFVRRSVARAAADETEVARVDCEPGEHGELRVVLTLAPGLDQQRVSALARRVAERIATDGEARARIDALTFAIRGS